MLGLLCAILPVTVRNVITLPCTLPSLSLHDSIQDLICAILFCNNKYLANFFASSRSMLFKTSSLTITLPLSVCFLGFQPSSCNLSDICCREPILKGMYFVFVFKSFLVGSKCVLPHVSKALASSFNVLYKDIALRTSNAKPFFSCWSMITLT